MLSTLTNPLICEFIQVSKLLQRAGTKAPPPLAQEDGHLPALPGERQDPRNRRWGREGQKSRSQRGGQGGGLADAPLLTPGQGCLPDTDSMERVSSAWHHLLAPEGTQDVGRKTLFCQVAEHNFHMEPGPNASTVCARRGPLMTPATLPSRPKCQDLWSLLSPLGSGQP